MSREANPSAREPYEPPASVRRESFDVVLWRKPLAMAMCYEGYALTNDVVEPDIFDLYDVQVHPGNEPGTGSRVVRAALEEAGRRGFALGRSYLLNARMVSIMSRMQAEERIGGVKFIPASSRPTAELLALDGCLSVAHATDRLNQSAAVGYIAALDCVFQIT